MSITLPLAPWDAPKVTEADMIASVSVPAPPHMRKLIERTFAGKVGPEDMAYMAKALLQMADELFTLRARLDALEKSK